MEISDYTIKQLVPFITGDNNSPTRTGRQLIELFNKHGIKDIYDQVGLPDIGKKNGQRPSRKEYVEARLHDLLNKSELRDLLNKVFNELDDIEKKLDTINSILVDEGYNLILKDGTYSLIGGTIDRTLPVVNEAHFLNIQDKILHALDNAKVSIHIAMAWFTNETLFNKLIEKQTEGIDVKVIIYNDGVNQTHGVDISQFTHHKKIRGARGGLMHNKFCVIDNQVVITGSYNWSNNAEFKNDENITVQNDPVSATTYSVEFRKLMQKLNNNSI